MKFRVTVDGKPSAGMLEHRDAEMYAVGYRNALLDIAKIQADEVDELLPMLENISGRVIIEEDPWVWGSERG